MKAKSPYATDTVKIHIKSFDTGSAEEWLDFLQSFLSRMKGWQQGAGVGPTIFRNLRILLQGTALSRFDAHATNIVAQTSAHAFACLDAMTAEFFVLRPDKAGPVVFSAPPVKFYISEKYCTVAFHWRRTSIRRTTRFIDKATNLRHFGEQCIAGLLAILTHIGSLNLIEEKCMSNSI